MDSTIITITKNEYRLLKLDGELTRDEINRLNNEINTLKDKLTRLTGEKDYLHSLLEKDRIIIERVMEILKTEV